MNNQNKKITENESIKQLAESISKLSKKYGWNKNQLKESETNSGISRQKRFDSINTPLNRYWGETDIREGWGDSIVGGFNAIGDAIGGYARGQIKQSEKIADDIKNDFIDGGLKHLIPGYSAFQMGKAAYNNTIGRLTRVAGDISAGLAGYKDSEDKERTQTEYAARDNAYELAKTAAELKRNGDPEGDKLADQAAIAQRTATRAARKPGSGIGDSAFAMRDENPKAFDRAARAAGYSTRVPPMGQDDGQPTPSAAPTTTPSTTTTSVASASSAPSAAPRGVPSGSGGPAMDDEELESEPNWMSQRRSQYAGDDLNTTLSRVDAQRERLNGLVSSLEKPTVASLQSPSVSSTTPTTAAPASAPAAPAASAPAAPAAPATTSAPAPAASAARGPSPSGGGSGKMSPTVAADVSGNPVDKPIPPNSPNNRRPSTTKRNEEEKVRSTRKTQIDLARQAHKDNKARESGNYTVPPPPGYSSTDGDPDYLEDD